MTARFSWNQQNTRGHRPRLQYEQKDAPPLQISGICDFPLRAHTATVRAEARECRALGATLKTKGGQMRTSLLLVGAFLVLCLAPIPARACSCVNGGATACSALSST